MPSSHRCHWRVCSMSRQAWGIAAPGRAAMLEVVIRAKTEGEEQHNHQDEQEEIESNVAPASRRGWLVHTRLIRLLLTRYRWQRGNGRWPARRRVRATVGKGGRYGG